jgi:hypothetical protein
MSFSSVARGEDESRPDKYTDEQVIARTAPQVRQCFDRARQSVHKVEGKAQLNVLVDEKGDVARVAVAENAGLPEVALKCVTTTYEKVTEFRGNNTSERTVMVPVSAVQQRG